jgi:lipoprotein-anchoring transpeptidase ErfK/SrfK
VVGTSERRLYNVTGVGQAIRYPGTVGKHGSCIDRKYIRPDWSPPAAVRKDKPNLPKVIAGGSPRNPMGVVAMSFAGGEYAIHGTNQPGSISHFVCIRMYNEDTEDLYGRVSVGRCVIVQ